MHFSEYFSLPTAEREQTRPPDQPLGKEIYEDIMPPLMDLFHGKCAFCEGNKVSVDPYQFRPTAYAFGFGKADSEQPIYYGWLAYAWQNLYLVCEDCHPSNETFFPTLGPRSPVPKREDLRTYVENGDGVWPFELEEWPEILDPCGGHRFHENFSASRDGKLQAITPEAENTIEMFRLNREDLVARRAAAISEQSDKPSPSDIPEEAEFAGILAEFFQPIPELASLASTLSAPKPRGKARQSTKAHRSDPFYDIETIEISDFRALENLKLTMPPRPSNDLARAILVLGENATGKSTLLEAVTLTLLSDEAREMVGEKAHTLFLNPKYMGSKAPKKSMARVKLTLSGPDGEERKRALTVTGPGGIQTDGDPFPDDYPVFAYGAYRHYLDPIRRWRADRGVRNLFHSDDLLSNPKKWLISLDDYQRRLVIMALRIIIGGGFSTIDFRDDDCYVVIRNKPQGPDPFARDEGKITLESPLDTLSSGFRTILALSCDMMRWLMKRDGFTAFEHSKGLCIIDEVEAHLHPRWKVSIMTGLRRAFPAMTFIVTTHDPLCIRGMKNGEVMVLQRLETTGKESDLPVFVDALTTLPDVTQLTVEQLLSSDLFDLFDTTDVETGQEIAQLTDILAQWRNGDAPTKEAERAILSKFQSEIMTSLPIGATEVSRIVEEAVADFLVARRNTSSGDRQKLRDETKAKIIAALGGL